MSILDDIFGTKPEIAPYTPTDLGSEELRAITENINAFPDITQLGNLFEQYMMNSFDEAGFDIGGLLQSGGQATRDMLSAAEPLLHGEIPKDVQEQVQRSSAFSNLMAGTSGSPMGSANTARDLGLTSLDLINQGSNLVGAAGNAAQRWAGLASGLIMSPSGMMVTPEQQAQMTMQNNLYKQATQQLGFNVAAAPNPTMKGLSDIVENLTAAYLGGKVGSIGAGNAAATTAATPSWGSNLTQGGYGGVSAGFQPAPGVTTAASDYNIFDPSGGYMYG